MPTVPQITDTRVQRSPMQGGEQRTIASQELLAGGAEQRARLGQAIANAGQGLSQIATEMAEKRNLAMVAQAETLLAQQQLEFERTIKQRRGWQADGAFKEAGEWWSKSVGEHAATLENPRQRETFARLADQRRLQSVARVAEYQQQELDRATVETLEASIVNEIEAAALYPTDEPTIATSVQSIMRKSAVLAAQRGWGAEQREAYTRDKLSAMHKRILDARLGAPDMAQQYLEQYGGQMSAGDRQVAAAHVAASKAKVEVATTADRIYATAASPADALRAARDIQDPMVRDSVVAAVEKRIAVDEAATKAQVSARKDEAYRILSETGDVDAIPADVWAQLDGETQIELQQKSASIAKQIAQLGAVETDPAAYYQLELMQAENPEAFGRLNLLEYVDRLDESDRERFMQAQAKIRSGGAAGPEVASARSKWQIIKQAAAALGLDPSKAEKKGGAGDDVRAFYDRVDAELGAYQQAFGKPAGPREIKEIVDRLQIKVITDYWDGIADGPVYQTEIPGIPPNEIDDIAHALVRSGEKVTPDNILRMWEALNAFQGLLPKDAP